MTMSFKSRLLKGNGSPPPPHESWCATLPHCPPPPTVTIARISVTMAQNVCSIPVPPINRWHLDILLIIVWRPNVISVVDGDIQTMSAIFRSVVDVMSKGMWEMTVQSTPYLNQKLTTLMLGPTRKTTTSIPLWMTSEKLRYVESGTQMYEGGNVTIFFLSHVFFLISVVRCPYFHFAPHYEETDHYLLALTSSSSPLFLPL